MNKQMLNRFTSLVDFLGKALGPDYEVTLHDLESRSIVAIANGRVSGRTVGAPLTETATELLEQKEYERRDYILNYAGLLASGKTIRSSSLFIKNDAGAPVALLCINFDDSRFHALSDTLLKMVHPDQFFYQHYTDASPLAVVPSSPAPPTLEPPQEENFHNDVAGMMEELFQKAAQTVGVPLDRLTQDERTALIAQLNDLGIFRFKGAVQYAAEQLACSQASIYRYLSKVKHP